MEEKKITKVTKKEINNDEAQKLIIDVVKQDLEQIRQNHKIIKEKLKQFNKIQKEKK